MHNILQEKSNSLDRWILSNKMSNRKSRCETQNNNDVSSDELVVVQVIRASTMELFIFGYLTGSHMYMSFIYIFY
jgi:hypothetical protein